jgi:hypothetical protein
MRKILSITLFTFILTPAVFSQGIIFDSAQFASREQVRITRAPLPRAYSLKKYTPIGYPQVGSTCVAHSFATARTILAAKSLGWTDKQKITGLYFSPYYIYFRNKFPEDVNCNYGLNVEETAKDVLKNGFAPITDVEYPYYYPFTKSPLCIEKKGTDYPPSMQEDENNAANYKIDEIYTVTTITQLKTALSKGMPVAVILFPPPSFTNAKSDLWASLPTEFLNRNIMAHAVLAIGYDDAKYGGSIEIMNSWGDTWGNKGFTNIRYKDYSKFFVGGYAFYVKDNNKPAIKPTTVKPTNTVIKNNSQEKKEDPSKRDKDSAPTLKEAVTPTTINVRKGYGNGTIKFNNSELVKAFKK